MKNNSVKYGDVDGDGQINAIDFAQIKKYLLGNVTLTADAFKAADVNGDSLVDAIDFAIYKQFLLGIISVFPVENLPQTPIIPTFKDVTVHDPSIIKTNGTYYVIGSHLASAKTNDLMQWYQISSSVSNTNPLIPNVFTELKESFDWAQTDTMWAGDIIQLQDGKFYMYYCLCKGDSPRSTLGLAVSDNVTGPYKNAGILLKSGMNGIGEAGTVYNATRDPNTVDPHTFFDKDGNLWMVYGSYSGGIFIMKMDPKTGKPYPGQGYGKKLLGGNHSRIEAPYMLYSPQSDYYYLFLSFGGLDSTGGYNIRVARSKNPDGPFVDGKGKNMIDCQGAAGTIFDDRSIEPYGVKVMGNFKFTENGVGYVSPGHNSAYYDAETKKYYLIFHTRFPGQGEFHQVRVHQMFINEDGWPVVAPHRYGGETISKYIADEVYGDYAFINHGNEISSAIKNSVKITLNKEGTISGSVNGKWKLSDENIELTVNGVDYSGVVLRQWENSLKKFVMTFSAIAKNGNVAIWGSKIN
ncbi:family 43 glycosylhydrolase [Ruminiclostridium josui]|uniref:family 43 glycosylhydrolase n=1 Tax=Ruminiclostridium josui TaxID=1499 RepID=UPI000464F3F3|nr:family 43 glycosylhydrolase [Ruminiclostridium josui]